MDMQNGIKNVSMMRKWFIFLLIAPGIFLIIWFFSQSDQTKIPDTMVLPQNFLEGGIETKANGVLVKVGESNQPITSDNIKLPLNDVIVEPGFTLMAFPVYLSQPDQEIKWKLVDGKGREYNLLSIDQNAIIELIESKASVKNKAQRYLLFKTRTGEKYYFLVAEVKGKEFAWRFMAAS